MTALPRRPDLAIFDRHIAATFLDMLHGDRRGYVIASRGVEPHYTGDGRYAHAKFHDLPYERDQRDRFLSTLDERAPVEDIYVCPYLRTMPNRRLGDSEALPATYLIADIDGVNTVDDVDGLREILVGLGGIVVSSGNGLHVYVWLPAPLGDADLAHWNRRLAAHLGGDAKWQTNSLLRLPGTFNHKPRVRGGVGEAVPVEIIETAEPGAWTLDDLDAILPEAEADEDVAASRAEIAEINLDEVPEKICDRLDEKPDDDRSTQTYGFVVACYDAGLSESQALALGLQHRPTREREDKTNVEKDVRRVVGKVYGDTSLRATLRVVQDESRRADPAALQEVVTAFREYLDLPDPGALYVVLAAVVANRMKGDPLWLLLVAAASRGKTEVITPLDALDFVHPVATMTEAALLSGSPRKEKAKDATGGVLRQVGEFGVITMKDFGSILSMHRDARAATLAALREVYDGSWSRALGTDGGKVITWTGKCGLVAGVTTSIDSHHGVVDTLGPRFVYFRLPGEGRRDRMARAFGHARGSKEMRDALRAAVERFFGGLDVPQGIEHDLSEDDKQRLGVLADFVTIARSPVERDGYTREIVLIPDAEDPTRLGLMLAAMLEALRVIGVDEEVAWTLVRKIAFDSMPQVRRRVIEFLADEPNITTKQAALLLDLPTTTTRRALEDLAAHHVIRRFSLGGENDADYWELQEERQADLAEILGEDEQS